ncbi:LytR/AlgR family response regulator transcription factor [Chitinophaga cymbidii]|uniref:DNA-binding response regulator n=1 Tax=Chitinophaga cymbidii TaxID=1096750 RepID=A0A512RL11_9BACT|nr:response regulator transcription factor [Chitinophaga cymbidii]GEP96381.1 DNA-binding response regulator [Chitinophaga cymbidii]
MQVLRCLIVDDEPGAHYVLEAHIEKVQALQIVGHCYNAMETANFLHREKVDLVFLDINMPELSGLDLLKILNNNHPKIILTSAYSEFALESYEYDVVDYILKPISFPRFLKAVNKILQQEAPPVSQPQEPLVLKTGSTQTTVDPQDIYYVQSMGNYVKVYLENKCLVVNATTAEMEKLLPTGTFVRIHKSYIIAADKVEEWGPRHVVILDESLPVGQTFKINLNRLKER